MPNIRRRLFCVCLIGCFFLAGCSSEKTKTKQAEQAAKVNEPELKGPNLSANGLEKVTIESFLSRNDLNEKARSEFLARQKRGQTTMMSREADKIIADSLIVEPVLETLISKFGRGEIRTPSLATFESKPSSTYPEEVPGSVDHFKGLYSFYRLGIKHFENRKFANLTSSDKAKVVAYMNRVFDQMEREDTGGQWAQLRGEGDQLLAKYTDLANDPMFHLCFGTSIGANDDFQKCHEVLLKAIDLFSIQDYPTRCAIIAHGRLDNFRWRNERPRATNQRWLRRCLAMKYWLEKDFRATEEEHRYAYDEIETFIEMAARSKDWAMLETFAQSVESNKRLAPWVKSMVLGDYNYEVGYGWRGTGYANTVTKEGWEKLEEYCKIAKGHYEKAYQVNPRFAEAATNLISISNLGYAGKSEQHWFEKALEHEPGYSRAYRARCRSLLPKWGGSYEELFEMAKTHALKSIDAKGPLASDPAIGIALIDALFWMRQESGMSRTEFQKFCSEPGRAKVILDVIDDLIEKDQEVVMHGKIRGMDYLLTFKALFAKLTGEMNRAEVAFQRLEKYNAYAARMFQSTGDSFNADRAAAYIATSENGDLAAELNKLIEGGYESRAKNREQIVDLAGQLAELVPPQNGGLAFKRILDQAVLEHEFRLGKEVKLSFNPDFRMWRIRDPRQLKHISTDEISIDNRKYDMSVLIESISQFPGDKQIHLDITFPIGEDPADFSKTPEFTNSKELAMTVMTHAAGTEGQNLSIGLKRDNRQTMTPRQQMDKHPGYRMGKLVFGAVKFNGRFDYYKLPLPQAKNHLNIRIGGPYVEIYVNDEFVCRTWSYNYDGIFSQLVLNIPKSGPSGRGVVNVSNVRVKKWAGPPLALEDAKIVKYFQDQISEDPSDKWSEFWLAQIFHRMKEHDKAIVHYKKAMKLGIRESRVAFYIGDIYDRQDDWANAKKWYQKSVDTAPEVLPDAIQVTSPVGNTVPDSYPEEWSAFRLAWHGSLLGESRPETRKGERKMRVPAVFAGFIEILRQQELAGQGIWKPALDTVQRLEKVAPELYVPLLGKMAKAYQAKKIYIGTEEEARFYLQVGGGTPFFRHFEDRYPEQLRRHYRKNPLKREKVKAE